MVVRRLLYTTASIYRKLVMSEIFIPNYAFFDVDGTILKKHGLGIEKLPTKKVIEALRKLSELIGTGLVTGRQWQKAKFLIEKLHLSGFSVLSNGAQIYDARERKMVIERILNYVTVLEIAELLHKKKIPFWIQDDGVDHVLSQDEDIFHRIPGERKHLPFDTYIPDKPFVIVAHGVTNRIVEELNELVKNYDKMISFKAGGYKDGVFDVFITDTLSNKRDGMLEAIKLADVKPDKVIAFGDSYNDIIFMNYFFSVAMGNAVPEVQALATDTTLSVNRNGVAVYIENILLPLLVVQE